MEAMYQLESVILKSTQTKYLYIVSIITSLTDVARLEREKRTWGFQNSGKQQTLYHRNNKLKICNTRNRNVFRNLSRIWRGG